MLGPDTGGSRQFGVSLYSSLLPSNFYSFPKITQKGMQPQKLTNYFSGNV